jgi:hydroxymethylpyrimidine/phosphomethylpyrimidine kinase
MTHFSPAAVLCIGGHDPCGGAGILADAEAVRAAGAFALTVVSALTDQDSCGMRRVFPQPAAQIAAQCRTAVADTPPRALKIGLIGDTRSVPVLADLVDECAGVPLVLDPVLASGAGQRVADEDLVAALRELLLPRATLVTPNLPEARTLTGATDPDECARALLHAGATWALITGTHDETQEVVHRLHGADGSVHRLACPRLPGDYHGSGCTLASAIAARLALGLPVEQAVAEAQTYAWTALAQAWRTGHCQLTPNRLFALDAQRLADAPG